MKNRVLAQVIVLILALTVSPFAFGQGAYTGQPTNRHADWQGLNNFKAGKKVLVELKSGGAITGKFVSAIGGRLTLSDNGDSFDIEQRDIDRVYRSKGGWSRRRTIIVGSLVGLFVGEGIGMRKVFELERDKNRIPSDADEIPALAGAVIGTAAGAGAGALLGGKRKGKLLYEAIEATR